ncbi:uncharacterized protein [Antedon mediterranea]|uniref:uncharacterized protein n=1 Tax=Antedon mediterranea TaxID=105859 RepID=UPI003AF40D44
MGRSALISHQNGKKHKQQMELRFNNTTQEVNQFFSKSNPTTSTTKSNSTITSIIEQEDIPGTSVDNSIPKRTNPSGPATMQYFSSSEEIRKAEILWALFMTNRHYSNKSMDEINEVFQAMFPDSGIAAKFSCGEKKSAYVVNYGLAPYFRNVFSLSFVHFRSLLLKRVTDESDYVLLFDESLNKGTQLKQMDIHVRFWANNHVETRFFDSTFMGHATAEKVVTDFKICADKLNLAKLLQIGMDGPNVNWKFYKLLSADIKTNYNTSVLNIGSCGLHVMHNGFQSGVQSIDWKVYDILSSLQILFKDTPARREDFENATGTHVFGLKFCKHRWVENAAVAKRFLSVFPHLKTYIKQVTEKKINDPKTKSYDTLKAASVDLFTVPRMHFFVMVATQMETFLKKYQTDQPMIPFLEKDLVACLRGLLRLVIKPDVLSGLVNGQSFTNFNIDETKNHLLANKVDCGILASEHIKELIKKKKVSELQELRFKNECKTMVLTIVKKVLSKCPLGFRIVQKAKFLDPRNFCLSGNARSLNVGRLKAVLKILADNQKINHDMCDEIVNQANEFYDFVVLNNLSDFTEYDPKCRIDEFYYDRLSKTTKYHAFWGVVKLILMLSHGQATVERGFSVNKEVAAVNMSESTYVSKRVVCGHIASVGGVLSVKITPQLITSVSGARQCYNLYLDNEKRKAAESSKAIKRKSTIDELDNLKKAKKRCIADIMGLEKSSAKFSDQAESKGSLTLIAKANSLRRTASEKKEQLAQLEEDIRHKLEEIKNS